MPEKCELNQILNGRVATLKSVKYMANCARYVEHLL